MTEKQVHDWITMTAKRIARSFDYKFSVDDLISEGYIGYLRAVKRYDSNTFDCSLKTYAEARVVGSMYDFVRYITPGKRIIKKDGVDTWERPIVLSVDHILREDDDEIDGDRYLLESILSHTPEYTVDERCAKIRKALSLMKDKHQQILLLYYWKDLTMKEIGVILGVTESRASQLHTKAIIKIKNLMNSIDVIPDLDDSFIRGEKRMTKIRLSSEKITQTKEVLESSETLSEAAAKLGVKLSTLKSRIKSNEEIRDVAVEAKLFKPRKSRKKITIKSEIIGREEENPKPKAPTPPNPTTTTLFGFDGVITFMKVPYEISFAIKKIKF